MDQDFFNSLKKAAYAARTADSSWLDAIRAAVDVRGKTAADIGCGGGIYSLALHELGAGQVIGIDYSEKMLEGAMANGEGLTGIRFQKGTAERTTLPDRSVDIVLERALVHHLKETELAQNIKEISRILKPGGTVIIQDRTPEDCFQNGGRSYIRGFFFDVFPRLKEEERRRRHGDNVIRHFLSEAGLTFRTTFHLWEVRRKYKSFAELKADLTGRTGRSILYTLSDAELSELVGTIERQLKNDAPIIEKDRWTLWLAQKE